MEFIDHTGHIYTLKSFSSEPVGYQWNINKYVFWINNPSNTHKLSIDRWYTKSIYPVFDIKERGDIEDVEIYIHNSNIYKLISPIKIQSLIEENKLITDDIEIDSTSFIDLLRKDDLIIAKIHEDKTSILMMAPFYIIGKSNIEGSILTDIMIHVTYEDESEEWCPITIGAEWYEENEPLIINGKNMGINLPKDILKAVYDCSFYENVPDYSEWNEKIKELLISYMHIKGECGNYNSAIDSLKWFGYGDKIEISSLLKTDNQFLAQYILDQFSLDSDIIQSYKKFKQTAYISLYMDCNEETNKLDELRWDDEFIGEGKPFTEDLFSKLVPVYHDEEDLPFWKPYYDWSFNEMALKLSILKYMYKKYFLPMHLNIHIASLRHRVFINDNKYIIGSTTKECASPILLKDNTNVKFDDDVIYLYNQVHFFDTSYNDINGYKKLGLETNEEILYINDICASLPIYFLSDNNEQVFNCHLILFKENTKVLETDFSFLQRKNEKKYNSLIIIPKQLNSSEELIYWINKSYRIALLCNGKWYYHDFVIKVPEMHLGLGKLEYEYITNNNETYIDYTKDDKGYIGPDDPDYYEGINHVQINNPVTYHQQINSITDNKVEFNSFMYIPSLVEVDDISFFDRLDSMVNYFQWNSQSNVSRNEYCDTVASKCYIYSIGLSIKKDIYYAGEYIVPEFYFNNGTNINNGVYKLSEYIVDIYFDYNDNGTYYAKASYDLCKEIKDKDITKPFKASYNIEYPNYNLAQIIENKKEVGIDSIYDEINIAGTITYKIKKGITQEQIDTWNFLYIDKILKQKKSIVIKFVISGKLKISDNIYYSFGGYDSNGMPKTDDRFNISYLVNIDGTKTKDASKCNMDCPIKYCIEHCKYKQVEYYDEYDSPYQEPDYAEGTLKQQQIVSENIIEGLNNMLSSTNQEWNIINKEKYYNRIHLYNIVLLDTKKKEDIDIYGKPSKGYWKYDSKLNVLLDPDTNEAIQSKELISIYRTFFNDNGTSKVSIDTDSIFEYDFYLMHDDNYWFGVFISKLPIFYKSYESELDAIESFVYNTDNASFKFEHIKSDNRLLINRLKYIDAYPEYHFSTDDIILATIDNVKFPFILNTGSKWNIKPFSLGIDENNHNITADTNSAIISIGNNVNSLHSGYYNISIQYSVDGSTQHQQIKKARILIE